MSRGSSMMTVNVSKEQVWNIVKSVNDPELPYLSIFDLGLIAEIRFERHPIVRIMPTYSGCPAKFVIEQALYQAFDDAGIVDVKIESVRSPVWSTDLISQKGRDLLKANGIAPPSANSSSILPTSCPRCNSERTRELSRFGSTLCKSLWQCDDCNEPFEKFKCY